ncbi:hypothetical protein K493DRAFT_406205 [Basidiobolus meristosporus CBS 931.73]|uniref:Yeast cell wall synthesis Kre9/Knh1-like N-terminal domain-containing protein n=1 Tax=Basidiobolus meristosporus CBS 931.73 TaxID=1314790 RepID=A0A1Y1YNP3_9FUNG|nr:hypothetical protein K493DRAFT_406205 [Basidiobolus meristosporus CBS 931.73]|eukprot:ORX99598.1 hypothetical protein K493DRAFT_406205 [Basidiobolus meristosporus CBS 931.73]
MLKYISVLLSLLIIATQVVNIQSVQILDIVECRTCFAALPPGCKDKMSSADSSSNAGAIAMKDCMCTKQYFSTFTACGTCSAKSMNSNAVPDQTALEGLKQTCTSIGANIDQASPSTSGTTSNGSTSPSTSSAKIISADIALYAPGNNAVDAGSTVEIKWEGEPKNTTKSVDLDLMTGSSSQLKSASKIVKNLGTGNHSYTWEVPTDLESGRYVIKMSGRRDEAYYGSYFEIKNPALPEKASAPPETHKASKMPRTQESAKEAPPKKSSGNTLSAPALHPYGADEGQAMLFLQFICSFGKFFSTSFVFDVSNVNSINDTGVLNGKSDLILTYLDTLQQPFESFNLSEGSRRIRDLPNAGGSSVFSEALSYELLHRLLPNLKLYATEMEVTYFPTGGPMTDYLVSFNVDQYNPTIGVSVTRAFAFRRQFTKFDALRILRKKLLGVKRSTRTVVGCDLKKQLLHIWAPTGSVARLVRRIFWSLEDEVRSNTFVVDQINREKEAGEAPIARRASSPTAK